MDDRFLDALANETLEVLGRLPFSSNTTLLVRVGSDDEEILGVYKPADGERPLWDFPTGLYRREAAAYELARAFGWAVVPPTVLRDEGPCGPGSVQLFVDHDPDEHYFVLHERGEHHDSLRRLCAFDLVANSADRKGGHVLLGADGQIWAIDNGLSLHAQLKLRTVIWDYAGEPLTDEVADGLARLVSVALPAQLANLLDPFEKDALLARARALLEGGRFPHDPSGRRWPWPLV